MILSDNKEIQRNNDESSRDNDGIDQPGFFNNRGVFFYIKAQRLECSLEGMIQMDPENNEKKNIKDGITRQVE
jgi:hypothetical protein